MHKASDLPWWALAPRLCSVVGTDSERGACGTADIDACARALAKEAAALEQRMLGTADQVASGDCTLPVIAVARLMIGACCEAFAAIACCDVERRSQKGARLYKDAALAAAWTSAHASYLADIANFGIAAEDPSLHSVVNDMDESDLSDVYARRVSPKDAPKECACLLSVLTRCSNAGTRGWDGAFSQAIEKSEGTRRVVSNAVSVSVTGMNWMVSPSERLHWRQRMLLFAIMGKQMTLSCVAQFAVACPAEFKEVARRLVAHCTSTGYASVAACAKLHGSGAALCVGPLDAVCDGLHASASAFAAAGRRVVSSGPDACIVTAVKSAFDEARANGRISSTNYIGKVSSSSGRITATSLVGDVWATSFRCNFVPFWVHASTHKLRASRLDAVQHDAIHGMNAATRLTMLLSSKERIQVQSKALQSPSSGILTLDEVATAVGAQSTAGCRSSGKSAIDTMRALESIGGRGAAKVMSFCRTASLCEELLVYDLGTRTARMQASALLRRVLLNETHDVPLGGDPLELLHLVPDHARFVCACLECRRVANACVCDAPCKRAGMFNELGTRGSMLETDTTTGQVHMRCAKRSSASLRAAVALEESLGQRRIEFDLVDREKMRKIVVDASSGTESGVSSRIRRDARTAYTQRVSSAPCGTDPMVTVDMIGKAVRIFDGWFSLCALCGALVRFTPGARVGAEICCMRCDAGMLFRKEQKPANLKEAAGNASPVCRFCGKVDQQRSGAKWRLVRSPNDTAGHNAALPPPLRHCHFCPAHFRSWIPAAMKTMATRVVLSHLVFGAKPLFDANDDDDDELRPNGANKKVKRRRLHKKS